MDCEHVGFFVVLMLIGLLVAPPMQVAVAQEALILDDILAEQEKYRRQVRLITEEIRRFETTLPSGFSAATLGDANPDYQRYRRELELRYSQLSKAEANLRGSVVRELVLETRGMDEPARKAYLDRRAAQSASTYRRRLEGMEGSIATGLRAADGDLERATVIGESEALLRTARLEAEMTSAALRRATGQPDTVRMAGLLNDASLTRTEVVGEFVDPHEKEAREWVATFERDQAINEYSKLARSGVMIDADTGRQITGVERLELAERSERVLVDKLNDRALKPNRYDILRYFATVDSRGTEATRIEHNIEESPEYRALDYLDIGSESSMPDFFRAMSVSVRKQQAGVNEWRTEFVPDNKFETGAGTAHIIAGNAGEMSLDAVDRRIGRYHREADAAVDAFSAAAATPDPADLSPEHHRLLKAYGYITGEPGDERYEVPTGGPSLSGLKQELNLPGAQLLDVISGKNISIIVASAAMPSAASSATGRLLQGIDVASEAAVATGMMATDIAVGIATDAAFEIYEKGDIDMDKFLIESVLVGSATDIAGSSLRRFSGGLAGELRDPAKRLAAEKWVAETLGMTSESALQSYFESAATGSDMTYEGFLSNMLNTAISKTTAATIDTAGTPDWIRQRMRANPEAVASLRNRDETARQELEAAKKKLAAVVGDLPEATVMVDPETNATEIDLALTGLDRGQVANRLTHALESGQITWKDLKAIYASQPEIRPIMAEVKKRRDDIFAGMVEEAKTLANKDLKAEYAYRKAQLEKQFADDPKALGDALVENERWYVEEEERIRAELFTPGSSDLTSDVDRSTKSEYVRKYLKALYDRRTGQYEAPATSAQAWDYNEYIDVFKDMKRLRPLTNDLADMPAGAGYEDLTHSEAVEANAMAAAMMHMTEAQRRVYRDNILEQAKSQAEREKIETQFRVAKQLVAEGDGALRAEMKRLVAENSALAGTDDLAIRAQDNLYGRRTEEIREKMVEFEMLDRQLKEAPEGSPEAAELKRKRDELAAEIERDWGVALREGIETYATFTSLEVVVNDMQSGDTKPEEFFKDLNYNKKNLSEWGQPMRDDHLRNMGNDQLMMMVHHMNSYNEGHESVIDAARAMSKYALRQALAMKLDGADPKTDPFKTFYRTALEMTQARKDPVALRKFLEKLGGGDADVGLRFFAEMIENNVAQAKGLFNPNLLRDKEGLDPAAEELREARARTVRRSELEREMERIKALEGPAAAAAVAAERADTAAVEIARLKAERERRKHLASNYRKEDWDKARELEARKAAIERRMHVLAEIEGLIPPGGELDVRDLFGNPMSDELKSLLEERKDVEKELAELRRAYVESDEHNEPDPELDRLDKQIEEQEDLLATLEDKEKEFDEAASEEETLLTEISLEDILGGGDEAAGSVVVLRAALEGSEAAIEITLPAEPAEEGSPEPKDADEERTDEETSQ